MAIVKKKAVKRVPGLLYYVDGKGNVCTAPMKNRKKKRKARR